MCIRDRYFVGYPTESEDEFMDTLDTMEKLKPYDEILKPLYIGVLMRVKPNTRSPISTGAFFAYGPCSIEILMLLKIYVAGLVLFSARDIKRYLIY